jgi:rhodanese-related sulfurtransferase
MAVQFISVEELHAKHFHLSPNELILDVRTRDEFSEGHIPKARNISHEDVSQHTAELKNFDRIYIHCHAGKRAQMAADALSKAGLSGLICIKDSGMAEWIQKGFPIEK